MIIIRKINRILSAKKIGQQDGSKPLSYKFPLTFNVLCLFLLI